MAEQMKVDVRVISKENIKPSSPTPPHNKTFNLSFLDKAIPSYDVPVALLYSNNNDNNDNNNNHLDISNLKSSLSETLSVCYPLAGRLEEDESRVSCNDEGVLFIETRVNCLLSTVLNSSGYQTFNTLGEYCLPPEGCLGSSGYLLSFQINVFECGSIVIGCLMNHKLLDASSFSTFLNYRAALATKRVVVKPDFESILTAFPPSPGNQIPAGIPDYDFNIPVAIKSFVFNKAAIEELKMKAVTKELPNPTAFEAVGGFICWHATSAHFKVAKSSSKARRTGRIFNFSANIRSRTIPPMPKEAMGNIFAVLTFVAPPPNNIDDVNDDNDDDDKISRLSAEIHAAKGAVLDRRVKALQQPGAGKDYKFVIFETEESEGPYVLNSWCKLGFTEVNFGFGKPQRIIPFGLKDFIWLVEYIDLTSGIFGIEAWCFLDDKEMQVLEADSKF